MKNTINITIENKLMLEKRAMNVYHHDTRSAHMISHDSSITIPLKTVIEDDYLHISVISGPGLLKNKSIVNIPDWTNFAFSVEGKIEVVHTSDRLMVKIPPGLPGWQLKLTVPAKPVGNRTDKVTIGDEQLEYESP